MAKSSIHIGIGQGGYLAHNSRESWSKSQVFFDEENEIWNNKENAFKLFRSELAARSEAYSNRTKQKLQKSAKTHLSAIINLNKHHTLHDLSKIADYIEEKFDTKVFQMSIHRDEGKLVHKINGDILTSGEQFFCNPKTKELFFDEAYTKKINMHEWRMEKNYHAHIEFLGLNSDGQSLKKRMSTWHLRKLQDFVAESLEMERGQKTKSYSREQMNLIKSGLKDKKEYGSDKEYGQAFTARAKELGIWIDKKGRKDTHAYKSNVSTENKAKIEARIEGDALNSEIKKSKKMTNDLTIVARAKIKDLTQANESLKAELKGLGAEREQHTQREQLVRDLKAKIKAKDLTISELEESFLTLKSSLESEILELKAKVSTLETENTTLKNDKQALKAEIATLPSKDTVEELNTLKSDFKASKKEVITLKAEKQELVSANTEKDTFISKNKREKDNLELKVSYLETDLAIAGAIKAIKPKPNSNTALLKKLDKTKELENIEARAEALAGEALAFQAFQTKAIFGQHNKKELVFLIGEEETAMLDEPEPIYKNSPVLDFYQKINENIEGITLRAKMLFEALLEVFQDPAQILENLDEAIEIAEPIQNKKVQAEEAKIDAHYKKQSQNLNQVDSFYER